MTQDANAMSVNDYKRKLYMEAFGLSREHAGTCFYAYVTYDKGKLKGFKIGELKKYSMLAWATVPISKNQILDMRLFTDLNNKILDFSMQYRGPFNNVEYLLSTSNQPTGETTVHIRSDYGHGTSYPHFDIQVLDHRGKRIDDIDVLQSQTFISYESAINAVFMQVEKLSDPLIGAKYWLSPAEIQPERVSILADFRKKYNVLTSLSIISRTINFRIFEASRKGLVDEISFWEIAQTVLQSCKERETKLGGPLDVEVQYSTDISMLPFWFIKPEGSQSRLKAYDMNGAEVESRPVVAVYERKGADMKIRDITKEEKNDLMQ